MRIEDLYELDDMFRHREFAVRASPSAWMELATELHGQRRFNPRLEKLDLERIVFMGRIRVSVDVSLDDGMFEIDTPKSESA